MTATREDRKARLAEAVWTIISSQGISAVSVRTVAAQAEMATGSLRHLFPTQAKLLEFSAELMLKRATERVTQTPTNPDPLEYALDVISKVLPLDTESRQEFEINLALIAATPTHPGLAKIRDLTHEQLLDLFARIVLMLRPNTGDSPKNKRAAHRLLALTDGLALHLIHDSLDTDSSWVLDILREELTRLASESTIPARRLVF